MPLSAEAWSSPVGNALSRINMRAETIERIRLSSFVTLVSDTLDVPPAVVAIVLVAKLQSWQSAKTLRLATRADEGGVSIDGYAGPGRGGRGCRARDPDRAQ